MAIKKDLVFSMMRAICVGLQIALTIYLLVLLFTDLENPFITFRDKILNEYVYSLYQIYPVPSGEKSTVFKFFDVVLTVLFYFTNMVGLWVAYSYFYHGSIKAMKQDTWNQFVASQVELGTLVTVSVERGGIFSGLISQIETEQGVFRAKGDIGSVTKGVKVYKSRGFVYAEGSKVLPLVN